MDHHIIKMPDIGEGIAEVEIVQWHVDVGDQVVEDEVLADVMTDKASVEIPSPIAGTVVSLGGQVGDTLAVGSPLITLQPQGVQKSADGSRAALKTPDKAEAHVDAAKPKPDFEAVSATSSRSSRPTVLASPSVRQRARHLDIDLHELVGDAGDTPVSHRDLDDYLLDRYSREHGAELKQNIMDDAPQAAVPEKTANVRSASAATAEVADHAPRGDTQIKIVGLRRQIALKMQESKRQIPHFSYIEEIDITELEKLRTVLNNQQGPDQIRLTLLPFLVRALVLAVRLFPQVNAHYDSDNATVTRFGAVHMGIATQSEGGLLVPVLHHAQSFDIWDCAAEIGRITARARRGKAQPSELTGSTMTISSLGALGGIAATPIINHPEVAIVGVNRIVDKPMLEDGRLVVRKAMNLSSSFDHRIIDGMDAAQFIQEVRRLLESPVLLFVQKPG